MVYWGARLRSYIYMQKVIERNGNRAKLRPEDLLSRFECTVAQLGEQFWRSFTLYLTNYLQRNLMYAVFTQRIRC